MHIRLSNNKRKVNSCRIFIVLFRTFTNKFLKKQNVRLFMLIVDKTF